MTESTTEARWKRDKGIIPGNANEIAALRGNGEDSEENSQDTPYGSINS